MHELRKCLFNRTVAKLSWFGNTVLPKGTLAIVIEDAISVFNQWFSMHYFK